MSKEKNLTLSSELEVRCFAELGVAIQELLADGFTADSVVFLLESF